MHDADWFKARYTGLGLNQDDLGSVLACDRSVVSRIVSGEQQLRIDQVRPLADALEVHPFEVLYRAGMWGDRPPPIVQYAAVISEVEAGAFIEPPSAPPRGRETVMVEYPRDSLFALVVHGDSMNRIAPEGSVIVVDYERRDLDDGQLGVFRLDTGEATFKRYRNQEGDAWLEPLSDNLRHGTIYQPGRPVEIIGRVIDVRPERGSEADQPPTAEPSAKPKRPRPRRRPGTTWMSS